MGKQYGFSYSKTTYDKIKAFLLSSLLSTNYEILWCGPGATNFQDFAKINALKHKKKKIIVVDNNLQVLKIIKK